VLQQEYVRPRILPDVQDAAHPLATPIELGPRYLKQKVSLAAQVVAFPLQDLSKSATHS